MWIETTNRQAILVHAANDCPLTLTINLDSGQEVVLLHAPGVEEHSEDIWRLKM